MHIVSIYPFTSAASW